ncbi:MAG: Cytochrome c family protein [Acidobacteria bacterium]|nr:Cytochrome c family protein [Acidobacteriota bacterium]
MSDKLQFVVGLFLRRWRRASQRQTEVCRTSLRSWPILIVAAGALLSGISAIAQKRRVRPPQRPVAARIDYSRFLHSTKQHQEACNTCHKAPTSNWKKARAFPDIADYPDHDACVRCHRPQFFKGAQPVICSNCHRKVSPHDDVRFPFRNQDRPHQFKVEFPHDKHQDVIARLLEGQPPTVRTQSARASFYAFAHVVQTRADYNNCTICHTTNARPPVAPRDGWSDNFIPAADFFKTVPEAHSACFNCHWKSQQPTKDNCAGCHKLAAPFAPDKTPKRISIKFRHEGGGAKQIHLAECTTCHINITKAASLKGLKPDVPITGCTECHNKSGLREDLGNELAAIDKNKDFVCSYCHTSDVGRRDPPMGHYLVAERPPRLRKEIR